MRIFGERAGKECKESFAKECEMLTRYDLYLFLRSFALPKIPERVRGADIRCPRRLMRDRTLFDGSFKLRQTDSGQRYVSGPKFSWTSSKADGMFPNRIERALNKPACKS